MPYNISNSFLKQCLVVLKQDDIKNEIKSIFSPIVNFILEEISIYLYLFIFFILVSFILHLGILIILLRNNKNIS
jgi:hypothetical protein